MVGEQSWTDIVCLPVEFGGEGELKGTQALHQGDGLGMEIINWGKGLKEGAAEEGVMSKCTFQDGEGEGLKGKQAWGHRSAHNSTGGITPQGREWQTSR